MRQIGPGYPDEPIRTRLGRERHDKGVRRKQLQALRSERENLLRVLVVDYVRRLRDVTSQEKLVLYALACRLYPDTLTCDPSYADLAADCALSRRSVIRMVRELERKRILFVGHLPGKAHTDSNIFWFNLSPELTSVGDCQTLEDLWKRAKLCAEQTKEPKNTDTMDEGIRKAALKCWREEIAELSGS